jgi:selenocysteine-specific elongation factor
VPLIPFSVSHNLPMPQMDILIESLSLRRLGRQPQEWVFNVMQWQGLLNRIEQAVGQFHQFRPELPGASIRDIQLSLKQLGLRPHVETPILEEANRLLVNDKRLGRRGSRLHLPTHVIEISEHDRQLWAQVATSLAPKSGSPLSLHQAAEALGIDKKTLETSLKNAIKIGEMVLVAKNRYLPTSYLVRLGYAAEDLTKSTSESIFTVAEYCKQTKTGRNFAIDLLEYFDRLGFTGRVGNNRRIVRPAAIVFADHDEN